VAIIGFFTSFEERREEPAPADQRSVFHRGALVNEARRD
jgi:hypothetical protein